VQRLFGRDRSDDPAPVPVTDQPPAHAAPSLPNG
jgi:hypothetical protein